VPIVYLHGVAIRDQSDVPTITSFLRQHVAPAISPDPTEADRVRVFTAFWGRDAVSFAWNHASLPLVKDPDLDSEEDMPSRAIRLLKPRKSTKSGDDPDDFTSLVWSLSADQLSSVLSTALRQLELTGDEFASQATALDAAVRDMMPEGGASKVDAALLDRIATRAGQLFASIVRRESDGRGKSAVARSGVSLSPVTEMAKRALRSASGELSVLSTRIVLRWRPAIDAILTNFFGDVFVYLSKRGDPNAPGAIITDFLDVLLEAARTKPGEPLVVLSHSMGGQIVYDCITYYIPRNAKYSKIKIDFWVTAGSQVGLFEEMKLFKLSDPAIRAPKKVPLSRAHLGRWYNVWDPHDILSYTAEPIFAGVDDERFESNLPVHLAHFGYLASPAFYHRLGEKISNEKAL